MTPVDESGVYDKVWFRVFNIGSGVVLFVDGIAYVENFENVVVTLGNGLL